MQNILNFVQQLMWPLVLLIALYYFASPLRTILFSVNEVIKVRGIKFTTSGLEIPSSPQQDIPEAIEVATLNRHYKDLLSQEQPELVNEAITNEGESPDHLLDRHEKNIVNEILQSLHKFLDTTPSDTPRDVILENLLCDAYICLYFERILHRVIPTQLKLLQLLQNQSDAFISLQEAHQTFQEMDPQANTTVTDWVTYLIKSRLIRRHRNGYQLTHFGREFLRYSAPTMASAATAR